MGEYIEVNTTIYVPLKPVMVKFYEKEEVELNAFQKFILEAIEDEATIEQMIEATQLTKYVIESELLQMEGQKLLIRENDTIALSELSKNILMISRSVESLNNEEKILCINLITGDMEGYDLERYYDVSTSDSILKEKIHAKDVIGIDIEDNVSFFADYMSTFGTLTEEQVQKVLASVYVEFNEIDDKIVYKQQEICRIPCLIGEETLKSEKTLYAEGKCTLITMELSTKKIDKYKEQIEDVMALYDGAPELLSDIGQELMHETTICQNCNEDNLTYIFDHVSGKIREGKLEVLINNNKRTQLVLKSGKMLDEEIERQIINITKQKWKIDERYQIKIQDLKEHIYKVGFSLEEL